MINSTDYANFKKLAVEIRLDALRYNQPQRAVEHFVQIVNAYAHYIYNGDDSDGVLIGTPELFAKNLGDYTNTLCDKLSVIEKPKAI